MSVLCEALSVIVPKDRLEAGYPGGVAGYRARVFNDTYCEDVHLTRVGFMAPADVGGWIDLVAHESRLTPNRGQTWVDVAVVDQFQGPTAPCNWLEFARVHDLSRAWLRGTPEGQIATPDGWQPANLTFHSNEEAEGMAFLPSGGGIQSTLDPGTGTVQFTSRGVVQQRRLEEAWVDLVTDEEKMPADSRDQLLCVVSANYHASPIVMFGPEQSPVNAIEEIARDVRRDGLWFPVSKETIPVAVGYATFGSLVLSVVVEGEGERPVPVTGNFVLAVNATGDPFVMVHAPGTDRLATSQRQPPGSEALYDSLVGFFEAIASRVG